MMGMERHPPTRTHAHPMVRRSPTQQVDVVRESHGEPSTTGPVVIGEDLVMAVDLSGLGPDGFEQMCQALAVHVLGAGLVVFGDGPDGGREATFDGALTSYPSQAQPWNGYVVLQAKFKIKVGDPASGVTWLRDQLKTELDAWSNPAAARVRRGRRPEYLIIATNVSLSAVPGVGGKDRIDELLRTYADGTGLKGWRVWDEAQIITFLGAYPEVRKGFSTLTTSNEVFATILAEMDKPRSLPEPAPVPPRYLPGEPGNEAPFQEAYEAAGGATKLGNALGLAREEGPGWVQHFAGGPAGEPAVLCALFNRPVVAVARAIWNEIAAVGGGGPNSGITGVGFPVLGPSAPTGVIGSDTQMVNLAGGQWGDRHRGRLLRNPPRQSIWQPEVSFDTNIGHARDLWTSNTPMDLRVRVAAYIPWFADEWRITGASRNRMVTALSNGTLPEFVRALAERLGLGAAHANWREINPPESRNNSRCTAHEIVVSGAGGRPAVKLDVRLTLPDGRRTELLATVDLRVDFDAIRPGDAATQPAEIPADLQVTLAELTDFFARGWHVATMILPLAAIDDPIAVPPAGAPRLEFYIQSERPPALGSIRTVRTLDMIDLGRFGAPRDRQTSDLMVAATTPLGQSEQEIESLVHDALDRMADDFGFASPSSS